MSPRDGDLGAEIDASRLDPRDVLGDPDQAVTRPPRRSASSRRRAVTSACSGSTSRAFRASRENATRRSKANLTARIGPRSPLCRQRSGDLGAPVYPENPHRPVPGVDEPVPLPWGDLCRVVGTGRNLLTVQLGETLPLEHSHLFDGVVAVEADAGARMVMPTVNPCPSSGVGVRRTLSIPSPRATGSASSNRINRAMILPWCHAMNLPPLTDTVWPVMNPAAGDARNITHSATLRVTDSGRGG